ncbi:hypothetical protein [Roseivirga sp. UBA1976]|uniref:hypothetical protein n=1 Tax=Roseivirga sp. UBA1976 TaxID=1947386 RepID=UPI00257D77C8|nr:hypothetical protein [Roseivirga sp. UBA1976]MEC7752646.1 hypothetical protein [Bacteroidota bacterium]|tara:strand:+ start:4747 stop:4998 length:252 start_codon:yes stop_codon:yes gene_type:complete
MINEIKTKISETKFLIRPIAVLVIIFFGLIIPNWYNAGTCILDEGPKVCVDVWGYGSDGTLGLTKTYTEPLPDEQGPSCTGEY